MSDSNIYKRCSCRGEDGKMTGPSCPKLRRKDGSWNPKHGTWYFALELPPGPGGKRRPRMRRGGFADMRAAEAARDAAKAKLGRGADPSGTLTTGQYLRAWIAGRNDLKKSVVRSYQAHIDLYLVPLLGHIPLDQLNGTDVAAMFATISEWNSALAAGNPVRPTQRHVGPAGMQRIRATLRAALSDAMRPGNMLVTFNAAKGVRMAAARKAKPMAWTPERTAAFWAEHARRCTRAAVSVPAALVRAWAQQESVPVPPHGPVPDRVVALYLAAHGAQPGPAPLERGSAFKTWRDKSLRPGPVMVWTPQQCGVFLDAAAGHRLLLLFDLTAATGLRRGEACGLRWEDLDLDDVASASGWVRSTRVQVGWAVEEDTPKSEAGERPFPIPPPIAAGLRAWRAIQAAEQLAWGEAYTRTGLVFTREDGTAYHPDFVLDTFQRLAFGAGLPPVNLHGLRHGAFTYALAAGQDARVVQELAGHSDPGQTRDYMAVLPDLTRGTVAAISGMIPRAAGCESAVSPAVPDQSVTQPHNASQQTGGLPR